MGSSHVGGGFVWWWVWWPGPVLLLLGWVVAQVVRAVVWAWWTPRRLERALRRQGIPGNPYRLLVGDIGESIRLTEAAKLKPMPSFSHDIAACVAPLQHRAMETHGPYIPTKKNRRMKEIYNEVNGILRDMITKREKAIHEYSAGTTTSVHDDLLGLLLNSNLAYFHENGDSKKFRMSTEDVIEECKLFYFAGQETTSTLLTWAMIALSMHPNWQDSARAEVLQVFGKDKPHYDGLSHLKIVTMILYEVLRLYPPAPFIGRSTSCKTTKLGEYYTLPAGVQLLLPTVFVHHDADSWGEDADVFNPERFAGGISKAASATTSCKDLQVAPFFPFGGGASPLRRAELCDDGSQAGFGYDPAAFLLRALTGVHTRTMHRRNSSAAAWCSSDLT